MKAQNQEVLVRLEPNLYHHIETAASEQRQSLLEYVEETLKGVAVLQQKIAHERQDELRSKRWEAFERLRQLRERIAQNHPGVDFGDSTEIIRQMREERSQYLADL